MDGSGFGWTYEQFADFTEQRGRSAKDLNPAIKHSLTACPGSSVYRPGGHSVVIWISPDVVAKVSLEQGSEELRIEQDVFNLMERSESPECPYIIHSFFRGVDVTFLELAVNSMLHDRLHSHDTPHPIHQWMFQLATAVAHIEALGYAHGDINPLNILFDANDGVKLIDFDFSVKIGDDLDVGYEPYIRQYWGVTPGGQYGIAGPGSEQFALGSIFWYMTRGTELYTDLPGPDQVDRLMDGIFPETDPEKPIDRIIADCWNMRYARVADLVRDIGEIPGAKTQPDEGMRPEKRIEIQKACEQHYRKMRALLEAEEASNSSGGDGNGVVTDSPDGVGPARTTTASDGERWCRVKR